MRTKSILWSMMTVTMTAMLSMSLTACGGGDDDSSSPAPGTDGLEGTTTVSGQDPEGTVVINMSSGSSGNYYDIGLGEAKIHIDENNNFDTEIITKSEYYTNGKSWGYYDAKYYIEFAQIGKVSGLSQVMTYPTTGWSKNILVVPGYAYVLRAIKIGKVDDINSTTQIINMYSRLYVVGQNAKNGTTIKYQTPFVVP